MEEAPDALYFANAANDMREFTSRIDDPKLRELLESLARMFEALGANLPDE